MSFPWAPDCELYKTAKDESKEGYGSKLVSSLPYTAIRSLSDIPSAALEAKIENSIVGKGAGSVGGQQAVSPKMRALGRWGGSMAGVATAPLFLDAMSDVQSDDKNTRKKGALKALIAGSAGAALKGAVEGGAEGGSRLALTRAVTKTLLGVPGIAGAVYTARQVSGDKKGGSKKLLLGGLIGAGAGALKGGIESAVENRATWRADRPAAVRSMVGRGVGRAAGGAVKGAVMSLLLDRLLRKPAKKEK